MTRFPVQLQMTAMSGMIFIKYCKNFRIPRKHPRNARVNLSVKELGSMPMNNSRGICNSNLTEWSTIQGVIAQVISKSDERQARGRFETKSTITP